jgi:hypothetical protein
MKPPKPNYGSAQKRRTLQNIFIGIAVLCVAVLGVVAFEVANHPDSGSGKTTLTPLG